MQSKKFDNVISVLRSLSMLSIVICHFLQDMFSGPLSTIGVFFGMGVQVFFLISGLLCGQTIINHYGKWILKRFIKICIPVVILIIFVIIFCMFSGQLFNYKSILIYSLNLQGLVCFKSVSLFDFGYYVQFKHLWFLTAIMICYLCTYPLQKLKKYIVKNKVTVVVYFIFMFAITLLSIGFDEELANYILYVLLYSIGYLFGENLKHLSNIKHCVLYVVGAIIADFCFYFAMHIFMDNTAFYRVIISNIFKSCVAIVILIMSYGIKNRFTNKFNKIADSKANKFFDKISFYVYLLHPLFIVGIMGVMTLTPYFIVNFILFVTILLISSFIMYKICNCILSLIFKKLKTN